MRDLVLLLFFASAGCGGSSGGGGGSSDGDTDVDSDVDTDADTDADTDSGTGTDDVFGADVAYRANLSLVGAPSSVTDQAVGVAADGTAYVLVQTNANASATWLVVKVDPDGTPVDDGVWPKEIAGEEDVFDPLWLQSAGLAVDPNGDVLVVRTGAFGWALTRFAPSGAETWERENATGPNDHPRGVAVDDDGTAVVWGVPGETVAESDGGVECQVIRYDRAGVIDEGWDVVLGPAPLPLSYCGPGAVHPTTGAAYVGGVTGGYGVRRIDPAGALDPAFDDDDPFEIGASFNPILVRFPRTSLQVRDDGVVFASVVDSEGCGDCEWGTRVAVFAADGARAALGDWRPETARLGLERETGLAALLSSRQADFAPGASLWLTWMDEADGGVVEHGTTEIPSLDAGFPYPLAMASGPSGGVYALVGTSNALWLLRIDPT